MQYKNPIIFSDYSDPDVIRSGEYFYLVASSFNFVPGVPVLRSKNLVEWELVNYVVKKLPFERFNGAVCAGDGPWAPSIREHNGKFYCIIPFPHDGIYVSEADSPEKEWSPLRPLVVGKGLIDPCPIWEGDRCYLVVAFAHSEAGFNSALGLYEVTPDLTACLSEGYKIIYDGHDHNPIVEGPKFYKRGEYIYILAPAGSVKSGWQIALRSKNVYGPYESKVILVQGDSLVNGPHQGGMVEVEGRYYFVHFQDMRAYGRVVHLQPVTWQNDWPVCGKLKYDGICGTPVEGGEYPVDCTCPDDVHTSPYSRKYWQVPSNPQPGWFENGNVLLCAPYAGRITELPNAATVKLAHKEFAAKARVEFCGKHPGDEFGFGLLGRRYAYLSVSEGKIILTFGNKEGEKTAVICDAPSSAELEIRARFIAPYTLSATFGVNGQFIALNCEVEAGVWVGARIAMFARNKEGLKSNGYARVTEFSVT